MPTRTSLRLVFDAPAGQPRLKTNVMLGFDAQRIFPIRLKNDNGGRHTGLDVHLQQVEFELQPILAADSTLHYTVTSRVHTKDEFQHLVDKTLSLLETVARSMIFQDYRSGLDMLAEAVLRKVRFLTPALIVEGVWLQTGADDEPILTTYAGRATTDGPLLRRSYSQNQLVIPVDSPEPTGVHGEHEVSPQAQFSDTVTPEGSQPKGRRHHQTASLQYVLPNH